MCQFLKIYFKSLPLYMRREHNAVVAESSALTNTGELIDESWGCLVSGCNVLVMPATLFLVHRPDVDHSHRLKLLPASRLYVTVYS